MTSAVAQAITNIDWSSIRATFGVQLTAVEGIIQSLEWSNNFQLTAGAIEILLIPIVQVLEEGASPDMEEVSSSLNRIFLTMVNDPIEAEKGRATRSALSVLKSLAANSCKVPPFCRK
jgi:hypothetical protein